MALAARGRYGPRAVSDARPWPSPLAGSLTGAIVRLEPLAEHHVDALFTASRDPAIWRWMRAYPASRASFDAWIDDALRAREEGSEFPFATVRVRDGVPVGSTRFMALRPEHRGLEIGWTWLGPAAWRTGANVEAKLLMLTHAFDALGCMRVELKTHAENQRSRDAMTAMGAWFEGIHRKKQLVPGIGVRDTAWFSIVDEEWPAVRRRLRARLAAHG
ncbi:GNAT family N-acetyltransferase [Paraconexibacter algicola]|uniref:GNAT family N-acetyltransferase n=1 Tax=Paraconexibacter algicola TaxID=2133960 RepID=A0A2T4UKS5_9ACTN|nr:GNAT family N-acetyltransferase [Paraconexibacter algicola]